jgi:hypothetical protein
MTVSRRAALAVAMVCAAGFVLRVIGLQYGLPAVYNPDEVAIMTRALSFGRGTLNPHNFLYPTFYFYVLFAWVGACLGLLWLTGRVASLAALQRLLFTDPTSIYTAGRALGAVIGTVTIAFVYRLGTLVADGRTARAAAIFIAVAPLHVRDSHYVKHDVPATLAVVMAYLAIVRIWPSPREDRSPMRAVVIAGAACGAAFSTHYYCIFLAVPLTIAIVMAARRQGAAACARQLMAAAATSAVVFFALSPFLLVEPMTALRDIAANRQIVIDRAVADGAFAPAQRYLQMLWVDAAGRPIAALAAIGVVWMALAAPARALLLLAFPVPFLIFIANTAPASRYLNPVLPFLVLFAAWGLTRLVARMGNSTTIYWIVLAGAAAPAANASLATDLFIRRDDTRTLAQRHIESHLPAGATILTQPYSAALTPSREGLVEALTRNLGSAERASVKFQLQLSLDPYPAPAYRLIYLGRGGLDAEKIYVDPAELAASGVEPLRRLGVTYVLLKGYNTLDPETLQVRAMLAREGRIIARFTPYVAGPEAREQPDVDPFLHNTDARIDPALERPGPPLDLWQLDVPGAKR